MDGINNLNIINRIKYPPKKPLKPMTGEGLNGSDKVNIGGQEPVSNGLTFYLPASGMKGPDYSMLNAGRSNQWAQVLKGFEV